MSQGVSMPASGLNAGAGHRTPPSKPLERLKSRPQFQAVLSGKTLAKTSHFALHCTPLAASTAKTQPGDTSAQPHGIALFSRNGVWLGAMVPKRWAKRAVTRNAIKRQIYTVSQHYAAQLGMAAHVVRLRNSFDPKQFVSATSVALRSAVRAELQNLFERACLQQPTQQALVPTTQQIAGN